jgi:hypothetical protein
MCLRLAGHEVRTARQMGWQELENGDLLNAAESAGFELFLTGDKNLSYQQNLKGRKISLVVLGTIRWGLLRDNVEPVTAAVDRATPGSFEQLEPIPRPVRRRWPAPKP